MEIGDWISFSSSSYLIEKCSILTRRRLHSLSFVRFFFFLLLLLCKINNNYFSFNNQREMRWSLNISTFQIQMLTHFHFHHFENPLLITFIILGFTQQLSTFFGRLLGMRSIYFKPRDSAESKIYFVEGHRE